MANAKDEPAAPPAPKPIPKDQQHPRDPSKRKPMRRCAKCATPKPESHYQAGSSQLSPYCTSCRGRFPSLGAVLLAQTKNTPARKR
ncbi:MAG: hypothetical protein PHS14_00325 [Elusimicrobia bacterium]|nr:hypothetical protein [Elusimicrobiota bacterium]